MRTNDELFTVELLLERMRARQDWLILRGDDRATEAAQETAPDRNDDRLRDRNGRSLCHRVSAMCARSPIFGKEGKI